MEPADGAAQLLRLEQGGLRLADHNRRDTAGSGKRGYQDTTAGKNTLLSVAIVINRGVGVSNEEPG